MLKRILLAAALTLGVGGVLLLAQPANASTNVTQHAAATSVTPIGDKDCITPSPQLELPSAPAIASVEAPAPVKSEQDLGRRLIFGWPCAQVEFTDNCDGTVLVTAKNVGTEKSVVWFELNGDILAVKGGETKTFVLVAADDANDITVHIAYFHKGLQKAVAEHEWEWNASCLEITSVSNCDNTFKVSVKNTSTVPSPGGDGTFRWQLGLEPSVQTDILAGQTLSENFNKGDVVSIRHGKDDTLVKTIEFVQPKGCATPVVTTPAPQAPPPVAAPELPVTGNSTTGLFVGGGSAFTAGAAGLAIYMIMRRRRNEKATNPEMQDH